MTGQQLLDAVADRLFLRVTDELVDRAGRRDNAYDDYSIVRSSALLRLLLLDGNRLVDVVNRRRRLHLIYRVRRNVQVRAGVNGNTLGGAHLRVQPTIYAPSERAPRVVPETLLPGVSTVSRDVFLSMSAASVFEAGNAWMFSVRDIISYAANVLGGVHFGSPQSDAERVMLRLGEEFMPSDSHLPSLISVALTDIAGVVLEALEPLILGVQSDRAD